MRHKCPNCRKPTHTRGATCSSCLGGAHASRADSSVYLPPPPEPTITEPPVYESKAPVAAPTSEGRKYDSQKPRPSLFPAIAMIEVGHVLAYGAEKYTLGDSPGRDNWMKVPNAVERYSDAMLRHIYAWLGGESHDRETKRHHLASVICCAAFILWFELTGKKQ